MSRRYAARSLSSTRVLHVEEIENASGARRSFSYLCNIAVRAIKISKARSLLPGFERNARLREEIVKCKINESYFACRTRDVNTALNSE